MGLLHSLEYGERGYYSISTIYASYVLISYNTYIQVFRGSLTKHHINSDIFSDQSKI